MWPKEDILELLKATDPPNEPWAAGSHILEAPPREQPEQWHQVNKKKGGKKNGSNGHSQNSHSEQHSQDGRFQNQNRRGGRGRGRGGKLERSHSGQTRPETQHPRRGGSHGGNQSRSNQNESDLSWDNSGRSETSTASASAPATERYSNGSRRGGSGRGRGGHRGRGRGAARRAEREQKQPNPPVEKKPKGPSWASILKGQKKEEPVETLDNEIPQDEATRQQSNQGRGRGRGRGRGARGRGANRRKGSQGSSSATSQWEATSTETQSETKTEPSNPAPVASAWRIPNSAITSAGPAIKHATPADTSSTSELSQDESQAQPALSKSTVQSSDPSASTATSATASVQTEQNADTQMLGPTSVPVASANPSQVSNAAQESEPVPTQKPAPRKVVRQVPVAPLVDRQQQMLNMPSSFGGIALDAYQNFNVGFGNVEPNPLMDQAIHQTKQQQQQSQDHEASHSLQQNGSQFGVGGMVQIPQERQVTQTSTNSSNLPPHLQQQQGQPQTQQQPQQLPHPQQQHRPQSPSQSHPSQPAHVPQHQQHSHPQSHQRHASPQQHQRGVGNGSAGNGPIPQGGNPNLPPNAFGFPPYPMGPHPGFMSFKNVSNYDGFNPNELGYYGDPNVNYFPSVQDMPQQQSQQQSQQQPQQSQSHSHSQSQPHQRHHSNGSQGPRREDSKRGNKKENDWDKQEGGQNVQGMGYPPNLGFGNMYGYPPYGYPAQQYPPFNAGAGRGHPGQHPSHQMPPMGFNSFIPYGKYPPVGLDDSGGAPQPHSPQNLQKQNVPMQAPSPPPNYNEFPPNMGFGFPFGGPQGGLANQLPGQGQGQGK